VLLNEANSEVTDVSTPVAEWTSKVITPPSNSGKACLLFEFYMNKNVFYYVSFEMIYRVADDAETVERKLLFAVTNDGVTDHVADVLEFSVDDGVSRYQVTISFCPLDKVQKFSSPYL